MSKTSKDTVVNYTESGDVQSRQARNIGIVMTLTLLSKIFGFARDMILAYFYGATNVSDAYLISLTIPEFVFSLVIQAIAVGFIPIFVEIMHNEGDEHANRFTNQVLTVLYLCGVGVLIILNAFPKQIVSLFATGFDEGTMALTAEFVRITAIALFFKGTVSVLSAFCQAKGEFIRPALVGLPLDIITIIAIYISHKTNTIVLAYGTVIASASQVFVIAPYCYKQGYRPKVAISRHDPYIKKMIALFLPVIIGVGANQINILVDRTLASTIALGGISALNYANKIDNVMENVIVLSIAGVMYPAFSTMATKKDYKGLGSSIQTTLDEIMLVMFPITVGAMVFAEPIIVLLFSRGAFDMTAVSMTSWAMVGYSVGMIGVSFRAILTRAFYSLQDVKTPVVNSAISVGINIVLNLILSKLLGIGGLALASSIASLSCAFLMLVQLKRRIHFRYRHVLLNGIKILAVSIVMGAIAYLSFGLLKSHLHQTVSLIICVLIGVLVYICQALLFKLPGTTGIVSLVKRKLHRT